MQIIIEELNPLLNQRLSMAFEKIYSNKTIIKEISISKVENI